MLWIYYILYFNRTMLELKHTIKHNKIATYTYFNRTMLELKHCFSSSSSSPPKYFNRTMLELKLRSNTSLPTWCFSF